MSIKYLSDEILDQVVGGYGITAQVALLSPQGSHFVVAPAAAVPGLTGALTNVETKGPGSLANIDIIFTP